MDGDPRRLRPDPLPPLPLSGEEASVAELVLLVAVAAAVECGGVGTSTCFSSDAGGEAEHEDDSVEDGDRSVDVDVGEDSKGCRRWEVEE